MGAAFYFVKPIPKDLLRERLKSLIEKQQLQIENLALPKATKTLDEISRSIAKITKPKEFLENALNIIVQNLESGYGIVHVINADGKTIDIEKCLVPEDYPCCGKPENLERFFKQGENISTPAVTKFECGDKQFNTIKVGIDGGIFYGGILLYMKQSEYISKNLLLLLGSVSKLITTHLQRLALIEELTEEQSKLEKANKELRSTQSLLIHSEKLASIGILAAGVAHEINNPIGFILSNLNTLQSYVADTFKYINSCEKFIKTLPQPLPAPLEEKVAAIKKQREEIDLDFILEDMMNAVEESKIGADRVRKIVLDLKTFSHVGEINAKPVNINLLIDSVLTIVWNEIKYHAKVIRNYGEIPELICFPQEMNQVFMNIIVNAAQAIEKDGKITIATASDDENIYVEISDTGCGIPEENLAKIFDPFFTTKDVGKGTGLGLNISYNIVKKHGGDIEVKSEVGEGTTFKIVFPIKGVDNP